MDGADTVSSERDSERLDEAGTACRSLTQDTHCRQTGNEFTGVFGEANEHRLPLPQRKSWADDAEEIPELGLCECSCGQLTCLSWSFLLFLLFIAASIVLHNPRDAALLPGFFLAPMLVLYVIWYRKLRQQIPFNLVLQNFAFGFLPGACIVMLVELALSVVFFLVCFNDQLGGWFKSATHDNDSSRRYMERPEEGWSAFSAGIVLLGSSRFSALHSAMPPVIGTAIRELASSVQTPSSIERPATSRRSGLARGYAGEKMDLTLQRDLLASTRSDSAAEPTNQLVDPLEVFSKMYGISIKRTPGLYLFIFLLSYVVAAGTVGLACSRGVRFAFAEACLVNRVGDSTDTVQPRNYECCDNLIDLSHRF